MRDKELANCQAVEEKNAICVASCFLSSLSLFLSACYVCRPRGDIQGWHATLARPGSKILPSTCRRHSEITANRVCVGGAAMSEGGRSQPMSTHVGDVVSPWHGLHRFRFAASRQWSQFHFTTKEGCTWF